MRITARLRPIPLSCGLIKIEINSNFRGHRYLENYWGNGGAMTQALLRALEEDGIRPENILLRPSEFADDPDWALLINEKLIQPRGRASGAAQINFDKEINRQLRNIGGIGALVDKGYQVVAIGTAPGQLPHLQVLLRRGSSLLSNSSVPNASAPKPHTL